MANVKMNDCLEVHSLFKIILTANYATVKYKKDKDGANTVVVKGLKKGTVSITVEVNGAKVTKKLKVVNPDFFE